MAILYPETPDDFKQMVASNCQPTTHMAVTDHATYIIMVPVVTSQHRHYIVLEAEEDVVKQVLGWLKTHGYRIARGRVEFKTA